MYHKMIRIKIKSLLIENDIKLEKISINVLNKLARQQVWDLQKQISKSYPALSSHIVYMPAGSESTSLGQYVENLFSICQIKFGIVKLEFAVKRSIQNIKKNIYFFGDFLSLDFWQEL